MAKKKAPPLARKVRKVIRKKRSKAQVQKEALAAATAVIMRNGFTRAQAIDMLATMHSSVATDIPQPWARITDEQIASIRRGAIRHSFSSLPMPPPGVLPKGYKPKAPTLAMDSGTISVNDWAARQLIHGQFFEGTVFLGYTYLAQLAQRAEYRRPAETLATEMVRKWIELKSKSGDRGKSKQIADLTAEMERLEVRGHFRKMAEYDGFMGRMHLYIDTGDTDDRDELKHSIGTGDADDPTSNAKFKGKKGFIKAFRPIEPIWCYPLQYNASNPLHEDWYNPSTWSVMTNELHRTRLLLFVGREVPDLLKPAYMFGGLSLSQMAKPTVDNWIRTRQSVADMLWTYSITVMKTNLDAMLQVGGNAMLQRIRLFSNTRTNQGVMLVDKEKEEIANVSAPLSGLDHLQAQAQEHMCSVLGEPVVKLLGIQPSGLNATAEGELTTWYDHVTAMQERLFRNPLRNVVNWCQRNLLGKVDPDITFDFHPLAELSDTEKAQLQKTEMETATGYISAGVLDPVEERSRLASDPESPYNEIDPEDVPAPPQGEGMEGLMSPGGGEEEDAAPDLSSITGQLGVARDPESPSAVRRDGDRPEERREPRDRTRVRDRTRLREVA